MVNRRSFSAVIASLFGTLIPAKASPPNKDMFLFDPLRVHVESLKDGCAPGIYIPVVMRHADQPIVKVAEGDSAYVRDRIQYLESARTPMRFTVTGQYRSVVVVE